MKSGSSPQAAPSPSDVSQRKTRDARSASADGPKQAKRPRNAPPPGIADGAEAAPGEGVLVELCCGTKSVSRVFKHLGIRTLSVDIDAQWRPDLLADIAQTPTDELDALIRDKIREKFRRELPILAF